MKNRAKGFFRAVKTEISPSKAVRIDRVVGDLVK